MAIGTRTYGTGGGASAAATFTCAYPASIEAGDLIVLACYTRSNNASAFTMPDDWASSGRAGTVKAVTASANGSYAVFYLVADGTETGDITVNGSASNNTEVAKCVRIPGASTTFTQGAAEDEAAATTFTNSGVTPPVNGCLVVLVTGFMDHSTGSGDTGFSGWSGGTNLGTWDGSAYGTATGSDGTIGVGTALQTTAAATGNISVNHTDETNDQGISYSFAVRPGVLTRTEIETATASDDAGYTHAVAATLYQEGQLESATASESIACTLSSAGAIEQSGSIGQNTVASGTTLEVTGYSNADGSCLVIAILNIDYIAATVGTFSVSGSTLGTFNQLVIRQNGSQNYLAGIFYKYSADQVSSETITGSWTNAGAAQLTVFSLKNARDPAGLTADVDYDIGTASTASTTPTVTLATKADGSVVLGAGIHINPGQTTLTQNGDTTGFGTDFYNGTTFDVLWAQRITDAVDIGSHAIGGSVTNSDSWYMAAGEILKAIGETNPYLRSQIDTATSSDAATGKQQGWSVESESVTASDIQQGVQRHRAGWEDDDTTPSDREIAKQQGWSSWVDTATASDQEAAIQQGWSAEIESATASDDAAYTWQAQPGTLYEEGQVENATASEIEAAKQEALSTEIESITTTDSAGYTWAAPGGYQDGQVESATASLDIDYTSRATLEIPDEVVTATDSAHYTWAGAGAQHEDGEVESATATDPHVALQRGDAFQPDSAVATDSFQGYSQSTQAETESIAANDDYGFTLARGALVDSEVETATATDIEGAVQIGWSQEFDSTTADFSTAFTLASTTQADTEIEAATADFGCASQLAMQSSELEAAIAREFGTSPARRTKRVFYRWGW